MHLPELALLPGKFQVVAACDIAESRRGYVAEHYPQIKLYADLEEMLKDSSIELITVATRSPQHVDHAIRALETGHCAVIEKPVAVCLEKAQELQTAAKRFPGKLFVRHNRRFEPAFNHVKQIIASGILGDVFEIKLNRHSYNWRDDWQTIRALGGGQLLNWGPHLIDHALQFLESPVKRYWGDLKLVAARGDAEDHVRIILQGENNRVVEIEISGGITQYEPIYAVYGTRGSLLSYDEKRLKLHYLKSSVKFPEITPTDALPELNYYGNSPKASDWVDDDIQVNPANGATTMGTIWEKVYDSIRNGAPYPITIEQALEVVRVTSLIQQCPIEKHC